MTLIYMDWKERNKRNKLYTITFFYINNPRESTNYEKLKEFGDVPWSKIIIQKLNFYTWKINKLQNSSDKHKTSKEKSNKNV